MSKMGEIHMLITEMLGDGMDENEIAKSIAMDFDVDEDFAFVLVEEIMDDLYD
jgi:hypothetical protein